MTYADPITVRNATLVAVYPVIRARARRVSPTPADADDLAHDAAVLFLGRWDRYDGRHPGAFAAFMVRAARQYLDQYRRARPAPSRIGEKHDPPAREEVPPVEAAEEEAARAERGRRLRAAVESLPDRRRVIITARYGLDGAAPRTLTDLAGGLGRTKQAVEHHQRKALAQLAAALAVVVS